MSTNKLPNKSKELLISPETNNNTEEKEVKAIFFKILGNKISWT